MDASENKMVSPEIIESVRLIHIVNYSQNGDSYFNLPQKNNSLFTEKNFLSFGPIHRITYVRADPQNVFTNEHIFSLKYPYLYTKTTSSMDQVIALYEYANDSTHTAVETEQNTDVFSKYKGEDPFEYECYNPQMSVRPFLSLIFISVDVSPYNNITLSHIDALKQSYNKINSILNLFCDKVIFKLFAANSFSDLCLALRSVSIEELNKIYRQIDSLSIPHVELSLTRILSIDMSDLNDQSCYCEVIENNKEIIAQVNVDIYNGDTNKITAPIYDNICSEHTRVAQINFTDFFYSFVSMFYKENHNSKLTDELIGNRTIRFFPENISFLVNEKNDKKAHKRGQVLRSSPNHINKANYFINEIRILIKELSNFKSIIPYYQYRFSLGVSLINDLCYTYNDLWYSQGAITSGYIFTMQVYALLGGAVEYRDIINRVKELQPSNEAFIRSACKQLVDMIECAVTCINDINKTVQTYSQRAITFPNYEIQTKVDVEKHIFAYTEFLQGAINCFYAEFEKIDKTTEKMKRIFPIVSIDVTAQKTKTNILFPRLQTRMKNSDGNWINSVPIVPAIYAVIYPDNKRFSNLYHAVPLMIHEISHNFRYIHRKKRNSFVLKYICDMVSQKIANTMFCLSDVDSPSVLVGQVAEIIAKKISLEIFLYFERYIRLNTFQSNEQIEVVLNEHETMDITEIDCVHLSDFPQLCNDLFSSALYNHLHIGNNGQPIENRVKVLKRLYGKIYVLAKFQNHFDLTKQNDTLDCSNDFVNIYSLLMACLIVYENGTPNEEKESRQYVSNFSGWIKNLKKRPETEEINLANVFAPLFNFAERIIDPYETLRNEDVVKFIEDQKLQDMLASSIIDEAFYTILADSLEIKEFLQEKSFADKLTSIAINISKSTADTYNSIAELYEIGCKLIDNKEFNDLYQLTISDASRVGGNYANNPPQFNKFSLKSFCIRLYNLLNCSIELCSFVKNPVGEYPTDRDVYSDFTHTIFLSIKKEINSKLAVSESSLSIDLLADSVHERMVLIGLFRKNSQQFSENFSKALISLGSNTVNAIICDSIDKYQEVFADIGMCAALKLSAFGYLRMTTHFFRQQRDVYAKNNSDFTFDRYSAVFSILLLNGANSIQQSAKDLTKIINQNISKFNSDLYDYISTTFNSTKDFISNLSKITKDENTQCLFLLEDAEASLSVLRQEEERLKTESGIDLSETHKRTTDIYNKISITANSVVKHLRDLPRLIKCNSDKVTQQTYSMQDNDIFNKRSQLSCADYYINQLLCVYDIIHFAYLYGSISAKRIISLTHDYCFANGGLVNHLADLYLENIQCSKWVEYCNKDSTVVAIGNYYNNTKVSSYIGINSIIKEKLAYQFEFVSKYYSQMRDRYCSLARTIFNNTNTEKNTYCEMTNMFERLGEKLESEFL